MKGRALFVAAGMFAGWVGIHDAQAPAAGGVVATVAGGDLTLSNTRIKASWRVRDGKLTFVASSDIAGARRVPAFAQPFELVLERDRVIAASEMTVVSTAVDDLRPDPAAPRVAEHMPGKQLVVILASPQIPGPIVWKAILRQGASYWRQQLVIGPVRSTVALTGVVLVRARAGGARVEGTVQGSPVVTGDAFLGLEHPMSVCAVDADDISCRLARNVPLSAGQTLDVSAVAGLTEPGQLRRGFLEYVERERVHSYRPFLHYNSWYDLGYFTPYTEKDALEVIETYGRELVQKRGVTLSSFLFDDGWDSHKSLWNFNDGFPRGFTPLAAAAAKYGAAPGVWMSPFGGYGDPRKERLEFGKAEGFETNERGFALSGPVYYKRFRDTCVDMITKFGVNQFKFDGIGRATGVVAGSQFGSDFEAAIHLIRDDLRAIKPDIFINLTTGTWPSPFWLQYADTIWRGGEDHSFAGVGSRRQQWITYRDAQTYKNVVKGGPLFPLSSLMLHGVIYGRDAKDLSSDPGDDFRSDVRAYFGTGTELQELYITPSLLSAANWDTLAESAKWARANGDVLADTHWIGGDPARLEVYGHAAWTTRKGIVVLRNPGDAPATFQLDVAAAFELPAGAPQRYRAHSPWPEDQAKAPLTLTAGTAAPIALAPFEVLTLEATPVVAAASKLTIEGRRFVLDGKPYQIMSGEMHYPRIPREYWRDRMRKARAMGLNTITTYVFWNLHEPRPGVFDFTGNLDVAAFVRTAQEEGLNVIVRPGPYVCSEWDLGGLPAWLLADRSIVLRSTDERFMAAADRYLKRVGQELAPLQSTRGGPIIAVQVENEYGSFDNDAVYMRRVRDMIAASGLNEALLYTADGPAQLPAGTLPDLPAVVNFGPGGAERAFAALRAFRPDDALMSGEYWAGWFDQWGAAHARTNGDQQAREIDWMLGQGGSFSLYMFHGGTTFGFMNGANMDRTYKPQTSIYDYDAALDESGRPTSKYFTFRDTIVRHFPNLVLPEVPSTPPAIAVPRFELAESAPLWSVLGPPVHSKKIKTMEEVGQSYGYILYRTRLAWPVGPAKTDLVLTDLHDYAVVFVNGQRVATLDRRLGQDRTMIDVPAGAVTLDLLVENTGRINFKKDLRLERKGITDRVTIGGMDVSDWDIYALPMSDVASVRTTTTASAGPAFYRGQFTITQTSDTFLDLRGWEKGTVWVNGHQLGRFWSIGPQQTLYVPGPWLRRGANDVVVFDLGGSGARSLAGLTAPVLDEMHVAR
ncbi:MAG: glycoside hydrolase family 35 protein [Vicinamibacterales bacterium]